jgi:UDP-N-acetylmuramate--alanine ligase
MIAWVLTALKQDPSFILGGVLANLGVNARAGKGKTFVIEADEYDRMFLGLKPVIEVVTNVEHDHPDCYPTPTDFQAAFVEFIKLLPADGVLIACAEDAGAQAVMAKAEKMKKHVFAYGLRPNIEDTGRKMEVFATGLAANEKGGFTFTASVFGHPASVMLQVPGKHNVRNALAALAVVSLLNLPVDEADQALGQFTGTGRRFEVLGEADGVVVIDDYGHHPTEIRATLAAARLRYPGRRIWAIWQPHTYSRIQTFFDEFTRAFGDADEVIVTEIYVAREPKQDYSAEKVVKAMPHPSVHFIAALPDVSNYLVSHLRPGDVLLMLSAGDADQVSAQVLARLQESEVRND